MVGAYGRTSLYSPFAMFLLLCVGGGFGHDVVVGGGGVVGGGDVSGQFCGCV